MKNIDKETLEGEFKTMEEKVMGAVQPPPDMYAPQYPQEPQGGGVAGFLMDTVAYQATGKPRQPPPGPYQ
jgi:hypothetical protein